jgi:Family of unknown function (DUF6221)
VTLTEFLLARIDEDERIARSIDTDPVRIYENRRGLPLNLDRGELRLKWYELLQGRQYREARGRVVAECAAKRRIVEVCTEDLRELGETVLTEGADRPTWRVLTALASPYAGHVDFREEWRPQ